MEFPLAATVVLIKGPGKHSQTIENLEFLTYGIGLLQLSAVNGDFSRISSHENIRGIFTTLK